MPVWIIQTTIVSFIFALLDALYRYLRSRNLESVDGHASPSLRAAALGAMFWMVLLYLWQQTIVQVILGGIVWYVVAILVEHGLRRLPGLFSRAR
ncbi:MAG: hypothetical protein JOZ51_16175 [Chloroflexi bacterium]|nr:hypothetical protein [Chloroflexota bacterium]